MSYEIELNNQYANQEFDVSIDGINNNIHCLLQTNDNNILLMSVFVNNEQIGMPFICYSNQLVIPFDYQMKKIGGNFLFETVTNNYPNYENFGNSCKLYFLTLEEIENAK